MPRREGGGGRIAAVRRRGGGAIRWEPREARNCRTRGHDKGHSCRPGPNLHSQTADDGHVPIYGLMFFGALAVGAVLLMLGVAVLSIAIRRREYAILASFCAVPGVALLAAAVVAFRFAFSLMHLKIPPGG